MTAITRLLVALLLTAAVLPPARAVAQAAPQGEAVRLLDLAAVRRAVSSFARDRERMTPGTRVGAWDDLTRVIEAVTGTSAPPLSFDELIDSAHPVEVEARRGIRQRDRAATGLLAVGYSARETADVVSGRISLSALTTARRMLAAGVEREATSAWLDDAYTRTALARARTTPSEAPTLSAATTGDDPGTYDDLIDFYAARHQVEGRLVRAMIAAESAFDPAARSRAGAIGLMQLMPGTARALGVNPLVPEQNIEGGVRYFSELLRTFGGVELALVAYNAGPGYAERYARGQTGLYGETRAYVRRVLTRAGLR